MDATTLEKQKRGSVRVLLGAALFMIPCLAFRFVPRFNDAISGKPQPVRAIAEMLSRKMGDMLGNDFPVILIAGENPACSGIRISETFNTNADNYYLVRYSEASQCVCVTAYGQPAAGSDLSSAMVLTAETGRNYGRGVAAPVKIVAMQNKYTVYPQSYLSMLDWKTPDDPSKYGGVGRLRGGMTQSSQEKNVRTMDLELNFLDLRASVARRHHAATVVLNSLILLCLGALAFSSTRLRTIYGRFCRHCLPYDPPPGFRVFLREEASAIVQRTRESDRLKQHQEAEHGRAAKLLKRAREAESGQLKAILETLPEGAERERIQQCLQADNLEDMRTLLSEFEGRTDERSPDERLRALLETLREYCTPEEFDGCCAQAFEILERDGFREARGYAVAAHDRFRARFKLKEQEEPEKADGSATVGEETP